MSENCVPVVCINRVEPIEGADKIEAAYVGDYQCVVLKNQFKKGDLAVYIPEGYIVPDNILRALGLEGKLSGSKKNRVKAIKLRKCLSQGILMDWGTYAELRLKEPIVKFEEGANVAETLGIEKWEPVLPPALQGGSHVVNKDTLKYDFENLKRYPNHMIDGEEVVFTEKVHGTFCEVAYLPHMTQHPQWYHKLPIIGDLLTAGNIRKNTNGFYSKQDTKDTRNKNKRNWFQRLPIIRNFVYEDNCYWGKDNNWLVSSKGLAAKGIVLPNTPGNTNNLYCNMAQVLIPGFEEAIHELEYQDMSVYILGEIYGYGVQDLTYGAKGPEDVWYAGFDVYVGKPGEGRFLNVDEKWEFFNIADTDMVPILYRGPYSREKAAEFRDGMTVIGENAHIREGIVITPFIERKHNNSRVIFKDVSEAYLLRKGEQTEYN